VGREVSEHFSKQDLVNFRHAFMDRDQHQPPDSLTPGTIAYQVNNQTQILEPA